jgi:WD40 repeat protein
LIVGGAVAPGGNLQPLTTAELYDPERGTFTLTGKMSTPYWSVTATLLNDGRVLIVGSDASRKCAPNSAEIYDPVTGTFAQTGGTVTGQVRGWAILLHDGRVLVAGGPLDCNAWNTPIANPELYDPSTGTFVATGGFVPARSNIYYTGGPDVSGVSLLPDGRVLFAGELSSQLYDPVTATFSLTSSMTVGCWGDPTIPPLYVFGRTTTSLGDGRILLTGGEHEDCGRYAHAELYEPSSEKFVTIAAMSRTRDNHSATLLPDGTVLIAGGESTSGGWFSGTTTSVEAYDPGSGRFSAIGDMTFPRAGQTSTLLPNGTVLLTGGYGYAGIGMPIGTVPSAEIYTPSVPQPSPVVTGMQLPASAQRGSSFTASFAGSNLTSETFFDVRFTEPGSSAPLVSMNWQAGLTSAHTVPVGTGLGVWTVTGVRPHRFEHQHTGDFFPVNAPITVLP